MMLTSISLAFFWLVFLSSQGSSSGSSDSEKPASTLRMKSGWQTEASAEGSDWYEGTTKGLSCLAVISGQLCVGGTQSPSF
jgi:hypothetical protein